jgi:hypothetical protein
MKNLTGLRKLHSSSTTAKPVRFIEMLKSMLFPGNLELWKH